MEFASQSAKLGNLAVLGSTGSVGQSTLAVVRANPELFSIKALSAHSNVELLIAQAKEFRPELVSIGSGHEAQRLSAELRGIAEVVVGDAGLQAAAAISSVHTVVAAVVGFAGFSSVLTALQNGKQVALANKETLVAGGVVLRSLAGRALGQIVPVDSEHSSIFQCLRAGQSGDVAEIALTASGGPFLRTPLAALDSVAPQLALAHPNWKMGAKISVDSATMMNKGLEVIEASWLFDLSADQIKVVVHPQSLVHGFVNFRDGAMIACLAHADMKLPIGYALGYLRSHEIAEEPGGRVQTGLDFVDLIKEQALHFEAVDHERFPALGLCYEILRRGGGYPAVLNAANEVAVSCYLREEISFTDITRVVEVCCERYDSTPVTGVDDIIEIDSWGRRKAQEVILALKKVQR